MSKNERFENIRGYLCSYNPDTVYGVCTFKLKSDKAVPDIEQCLLCVANTMANYAEGLWKALNMVGVKKVRMSEVLFEQRRGFDVAFVLLKQLEKKVDADSDTHQKEKVTDAVEIALEMKKRAEGER